MASLASTICCLALSFILKDKVSFPGSVAYLTSLRSYFSLQETAVQPGCIVSPETVKDVSATVRILMRTNRLTSGCQFAIRSGGHASFAGAANIEGGVTIDLTNLDSIVLGDDAPPVVSVGTGATWGDVYSHLQDFNLSVNGGRAAEVGIGGLTVGGGISYFGPRFGWTCDTVSNFEVVLADGSIINANDHENPDLLWALRGGSNNFGIVTRVDLQTFEQDDLWGGYVIRPISTADAQIQALAEFNNPSNYDEAASLITTFGYSGSANLLVTVNNMEYTKPVEDPRVFRPLLNLPVLTSTQRIASLTNLTAETAAHNAIGARRATATVTVESTVEAINATVQAWNASLPSVQDIPGIVWSVVMDPIPPVLYARFADHNALGLGNRHGKPLVVVELVMTWSNAEDDEAVDTAAKALVETIQDRVGKLGALDPFLYINYAAPWQQPIASYGEKSVARLREVQRKYDPYGVFTNMVPGGFKLPG
ncbi:hypothetical protein B0T21DRAFT_417872 [Apiosordaria backusii]|uniref:FAD-binding PCMH-type domain-containing protein n=1 Tax=Apiosordaria backusii TaxID=314023 RepID=A0AA40K653_9PEZI|nr:hypothetical protein B0T21DRAFT_417872 [Apiosordaria backusii]